MKSVNRTFRLDEDLLKTVHELAHHKNVSMNEFVVDALRQAAADALVEGLEMEEVPSAFLIKIMEHVPTERVAELGRWTAANFSRKFVWDIFKEINSDTVINAYEMFAKKYKSFLSFEHQKRGSEHTIKILHNRGQKWSVFYAEVIRSAFKDLLGVELEVEYGPNEIKERFTEPNSDAVRRQQIPQIIE
ncbi:MAG TPA: hypothetical protein VGS11_02590 [Candidatus Bathyarchaeia archaeon]|nr:hypothetical protein [Candidatus Bathyarchaeia archaeon]